MVVVFPPEHPLAAFDAVPAQELVRYPFFISQIQSATRRFILSRLSAHNIHLESFHNMFSTETIKQSIIKGMGVSILSRISVETEVRHRFHKTAPLQDVNLNRKWYLISKKNHVLSAECGEFIQRVLDHKA